MKKVYLFFLTWLCISFLLAAQEEDGYKKFYYPTGKISSEGNFKNGKPDGYWKTYYVTGVIKSEGNRKNSLLDSIWLFYDEKGDTLQRISYVNGKKNGYYIQYYFNISDNRNYIVSKEMYFEDKIEGLAYYYDKNGKLQVLSYYNNGRKEGKEYIFNQIGDIITVNNYLRGNISEIEKINRVDDKNRRDGLWREYYTNFRVKREINYKNGVIDGIYKEFNDNGNLSVSLFYVDGQLQTGNNSESGNVELRNEYFSEGKIKYSGTFLKEKPIGIHRYFDESGNVIKSEEFNNFGKLVGKGIIDLGGNRQGHWEFYFENGEIKSKGNYINNRKEGEWVYYFTGGKIEQKGTFKDDKYNGTWTWYHRNGKIQKEENYFLGKNEGLCIEYDEFGNEIAKGEYIDGEREGEWILNIGDISEIGKYAVGLKDGKWKSIYKNGNLRFEGNFIQGNEDGKHLYYYENGIIEEERYFNAGMKEKIWKKYDDSGNIRIAITYKQDKEIKINGIRIEEIREEKNSIKE